MLLKPLHLPGVVLIEPRVHSDARGAFSETFRESALEEAGLAARFVQDNQAVSAQAGTLRGLHFQVAPAAQIKLVRCTRGAIYDVAVDLRSGSATYGQHVAAELSAANSHQLYIPAGFAHGYMSLCDDCEVQYKVSAYYAPQLEKGVAWNDPVLAINWPLGGKTPILSPKDETLPTLAALPRVFEFETGSAS